MSVDKECCAKVRVGAQSIEAWENRNNSSCSGWITWFKRERRAIACVRLCASL